MNTSSSNRVRIALILVLVVAVAYLLLWRPQAAQVADLRSERDLLAEELAGLPPVGPSPEPVAASTEAIALAVPPTDDLAQLCASSSRSRPRPVSSRPQSPPSGPRRWPESPARRSR